MVSKTDFDLGVLGEVAARPALWDSRTDEYRDSHKKPALWLEIAEMLQSTPAAVKARFDNIRCAYRKFRASANKLTAVGKRLPKPYKYAAEAAFLDAVFKSERATEAMWSLENSSSEHGIKLEPTTEFVGSAESISSEVDEDIDSFSSVGENATIGSNTSDRKRKKHKEPDFNKILVGAVQSIDRLSGSVMNSRKNETTDETLDDDWLFARTIYIKLRDVPAGREKDQFKWRMQGELLHLMYGAENDQSASTKSNSTNMFQHQTTPLQTATVYRHNHIFTKVHNT